jgi:RNA polymerase sigma-70 factor, ECF subfamily
MSSAACLAGDDALAAEQARIDRALAGCGRQLYPAALQMTGNSADAENLVQDTMTRARTALRRFTMGASGRAWLMRIMVKTYATRRPAREPAQAPRAEAGIAPAGDVGRPIVTARSVPSAEDSALADLTRSRVRQALAELPHGFRATIYLVDAEGYTYREAAELTGVPIGTVMSRLHRARNRLRQQLDPDLRPARSY